MTVTDIKIPGYNIIERLGFGGMATVYLAKDTAAKKKVALKVMSNRLGESDVWAKRFIQEAKVIAELSHPNVVPVFDVGMHEKQFYISMEYLAGGSLKQKLFQGVDIAQAIKVVASVAAGLDYATEKGFVHRDIKPDNIMFRSDGEPVILDFGIVKQIDKGASEMTQTGMIIGTAAYMSPEQAQGRELDQRSDIYSLGVLFYEMLTGKQPFQGSSDVSTLLQHVNQAIPRLPPSLAVFQEIIDKALAKDPFQRYTRAREIIDHIQRLEPQINQIVEKKIQEATDATVALDASDLSDKHSSSPSHSKDNKSSKKPEKKAVTAEEDLSLVLNSAKATIRNYSSASAKYKDRRSKHTAIAASFVTAAALCFIGYQQLVLVPQERAATQAKIHETEQKAQQKINALLAEAEKERKGMRADDLDRVDAVISIYRQVLKIDPENDQAEHQLRSLGERYLNLSASAVRRNDISAALTYREYAESLVADNPKLTELRKTIKAKREQQLEKEFVSKEVNTLIDVARSDFQRSNAFSDTAYTKIQQALALSPDNPRALDLLTRMLEMLLVQTEQALEKNQLSLSQSNIKLLEKYYPDPEVVSNLNSRFEQVSASVSQQQQIQYLRQQVSDLRSLERTAKVNSNLQSLYLSILDLDKNNKAAEKGLRDTVGVEAKFAAKAIENRQFSQAEKHLLNIKKYAPKSPALAELSQKLEQTKNKTKQVEGVLANVEQALKRSGGSSRRQALASAQNYLNQAMAIDDKNPKIQRLLSQLEAAYLTEIKGAMQTENRKLAQYYFSDTQKMSWPSDRIFQLQQLAEKKQGKKTRPVISGGF